MTTTYSKYYIRYKCGMALKKKSKDDIYLWLIAEKAEAKHNFYCMKRRKKVKEMAC